MCRTFLIHNELKDYLYFTKFSLHNCVPCESPRSPQAEPPPRPLCAAGHTSKSHCGSENHSRHDQMQMLRGTTHSRLCSTDLCTSSRVSSPPFAYPHLILHPIKNNYSFGVVWYVVEVDTQNIHRLLWRFALEFGMHSLIHLSLVAC